MRIRAIIASLALFSALLLACAEGEAGPEDDRRPGPIYKVVFKAPIHTCMIKRLHGTRDFVEKHALSYSTVDVRPYSQPPNLVFYREGGATEVHNVRDLSAAQIVDFLAMHGIHPDSTAKPEVRVSPPCKDEL